ncbi:MAG TPA: hypothetical protein VHB72_03300 [Candidatus Saccharimonadales bacterium]|nr:hypothetical protein [Candidatus Saccharimonadales bacterium]
MEIPISHDGLTTVRFPFPEQADIPLEEVPVEHSVLRGMPKPQPDRKLYLECFEEINDEYGIAVDDETGLQVEVTGVNLGRIKEGKKAVLFPSTRFSSATQNIGNMIELAGTGSANPNTPFYYVGYPGNGWSDDLPELIKRYYMETGRLTGGNHTDPYSYRPLEPMEAVARAVANYFGADPAHISANESGGRFGLGVGTAAPADTIKDAYLNGVPGISTDATYGEVKMFTEDMQSRKERRGEDTYEPGKVNPLTIKEAKPLMPDIYNHSRRQLGRLASTYIRGAVPLLSPNMRMNRAALHGHDDLDDLRHHALFQDVMALLMRHEALVTIQANFKDEATARRGVEDIIRLGREVTRHIPVEKRSDKRGLEFIIGEGRLDAHTDNPSGRLSTERRALRSIATFMRLVFSGNPDTMVVTREQVDLQEAQAA